jgi:hypothetical protein
MEFNRESLKLLPLKGDNGLRTLAKKKGIKMPKGKGSKDDFIIAILKSQPGDKYRADLNPTRRAPPPPPGMPQAVADQELKYRFAEGSAEEGLLLTRTERNLARAQLRGILDAERTFELAQASEQLNIRKIEMGVEADLNLMTPTDMNSAMKQARDAVARAKTVRRVADLKLYMKQDDKDATKQIGKYKVARYADGRRKEASSEFMDYYGEPHEGSKYSSFADYYRDTDGDGRMRKLERVKSKLDPKRGAYGADVLTYQESRLVSKSDLGVDTSLFEANYFGVDVVIALGQPDEQGAASGKGQYDLITFFKIYIVDKDTNSVKGQIGVYEVYSDKLDEYLDEDGDLDIGELKPLLFRFVDKQYLEKKEYLNFSRSKQFRDQERVYLSEFGDYYTDDVDQDEYEDDATHIGEHLL